MDAWLEMNVQDVNLESLAQEIHVAGRPLHVNVLARVAVRAWLEAQAGERHYAPGARYAPGETIRFNGQLVTVKAVQAGGNPKQGQFKVLTLVLPDGTETYMAAAIAGAPAEDRRPVSDEQVDRIVREHGLMVRTAVQEALAADDSFVWFQNVQGDGWCLVEVIPQVRDEDLARVWPLLQGLLRDGIIHPRPTEELVKAIWDREDDGSDAYALRAFALNAALQRCQEARWLGSGWVLEAAWQQLQERPVLVGPRKRNIVVLPPGIAAATEKEIVAKDKGGEAEPEEPAGAAEEDLEAWRWDRRLNVTITLKASHYYGNWLPLTDDMKRVFPPLASESCSVRFYHQFGGGETSFPAWVDWSQGRILGSPRMYQAFYEHGIYPGARLVISHRGSLWDYDVRTRPVEGEQRVRGRRVFLAEGGELEYEEIKEPLRYQVDGDVFVAAARWEDLPALFQQAEEIGAGIFQLMYQRCCQWWEKGKRQPLYVTAQQLFEAVHYDDQGRLTSKATVAWELWRRLAFESVEQGRYLFRPEKGERVRSVGPRAHPPRSPVMWSDPKVHKDRSLEKIVQDVPPLTSIQPTPITDYELPLLKALVDAGGKGRPATDIYPRLEAVMGLNEADRAPQPSGNILWKDNAYFAFEKLVARGEVEKPAHGVWRVTDKGQARLVEAGLLPPPSGPTVERRRDGQLIAADLVSPGPLFDDLPKTSASSPEVPTLEPAPEPPVGPPLPSQPEPPPPSEPPAPATRPRSRRNEMQTKSLFSNHYLETRLPEHPEWAKDPDSAFKAVRALWQKACQYGENWNEAQTEEEFVKPVLEALGWDFIVQPKSHSKGRVTRPDYALFESAQAKDKAYPYLGDDDPFYTRALAIAEAKYWGRPLSQKDKSGRNTWKVGGNPSHQMVSYLVGTRVPWGILTNGRTWRLYSREVSSTASEFYEVDLGLIFDFLPDDAEPSPAQIDQFRRWWLFFRRDAFTPDAQGKSFVQRVHEGSATYAREISDKLKELVFEQVVPEIAGGFVAYRYHQRNVQQETDENLGEIYQATLSLLYKLLFLLYAEARGLLPVTNPGYREQSLTTMAQWAADRLDKAQSLSDVTHATPKYDALLALFSRVDQGDSSLGIPRYNGGLFNPASPENRFLEEHKLSDRAVARAVDILVRDAGQPVDYAYISVRNLGAIYEGLLENKLRVVDAAAGRVELVDDKGERKASGSYYTPDYIVEYIVQHTLDPILDERQARFQAAMDRCADLRRQLAHTADPTVNRLLRERFVDAERDAREAFLGIKVCDPAMGSGHFLVNAVDHLTDGIIRRMQVYHDDHPDVPWEWNPIQRLIERVRVEILAEMDRQGIPRDPDRLDDTALLTRLVMKRCIYGVDLNRLAVELAKLSLWLHSFTVGAPLSFLDHHLRWGNSLIGSDVRTVEEALCVSERTQRVSEEARRLAEGRGESAREVTTVFQRGLFAGPFAGLLDLTALMIEVAEQADATLADVQRSAEVFEQFQRQLTPYKQVLDLWVSQHFGNEAASQFLTLYGDDVLPALKGQRQVDDAYQAAIETARALWRERHFFHWDLEFPEVFVDLVRRDWAENPGFDAVIGNPPYSLLQGTDLQKPLSRIYPEIFSGSNDISHFFMTRGTQLLQRERYLGFIVTRYWVEAYLTSKLRGFLTSHVQPIRIIDFGNLQVWPSVNVLTVICIFRKSSVATTEVYLADESRFPTALEFFNQEVASPEGRCLTVDAKLFSEGPWYLRAIESAPVWEKVRRRAIALEEITKNTQGIKTGNNKVFTVTSTTLQELGLERQALVPLAQAQDVRRYEISADQFVIYTDGSFDIEETPAIRAYLSQFRDALSGRAECNRGLYPWWRLQRPRDRDMVLYGGRILVPLYATENRFSFSEEVVVGMTDVYIIVTTDKRYREAFLSAVLNSRLLNSYHSTFCKFKRAGYLEYSGNAISDLPIRRIAFTTPTDERQRYAGKGQQLCEQFCAKNNYAPVRRFVAHHLEGERSDVVHDLLAFLAEQMIAMHKQKQTHLRAFRLDLAGYLDEKQLGKINRLYTPKKPPREGIKNYDKKLAAYEQAVTLAQAQLGPLSGGILTLDDFWRLNQAQWMWGLRQRLGKVADMSALVAVYERHRAQLAPLMRRIQRTDWLINQVVYQLYGLTEEEIVVVEGKKQV